MRRSFRAAVDRAADGTSDAAGAAVAAALAQVAKIRGAKAVHPHGVSYGARFIVDGAPAAPADCELLSAQAEWPAIVRFSRSVGLPRPLPDLLGMSIRVLSAHGEDRHQDFLLVTSVDLPLLRHIFLPATDVQQRLYSSSLPYRSGSRTFLVGARPDPGSPRPDGSDEFDRLAKAADSGQLRFEFVLASPLGRFERIGEMQIGSRLPDEIDALRYNPFNTGADLMPIGTLNRWRRTAYPSSQRAWGATDRRALAQDRAETELRALASIEEPLRKGMPAPADPTGPSS